MNTPYLLPRIHTRQLQAYVLISQYKSFTKAAEKLHLTQAGVSALIRELEKQIEFRLFERTTRSVVLTAEGQHFLPTAYRILEQLEINLREIMSQTALKRRTLRIAVTPAIASGVLPWVLSKHYAQYTDDVIEILDLPQNKILSCIEGGHADVGLGIFFTTASGINQIHLFSSSLLLLSPQRNLSNETELPLLPIELQQIPSTELIKLDINNPYQIWLDQHWPQANHTPAENVRLSNIESCIAMTEMGIGHFIAPDFVLPVCQRYKVDIRPINAPQAKVEFYAITRTGSEMSAVFYDFMHSFLHTAITKHIGTNHSVEFTK